MENGHMKKLWALLLGLLGCTPQFVDTTTPGGDEVIVPLRSEELSE